MNVHCKQEKDHLSKKQLLLSQQYMGIGERHTQHSYSVHVYVVKLTAGKGRYNVSE